MHTPLINSQFFVTDFRLVDDLSYMRDFHCSRAHSVYTVLRRFVWRGKDHSNKKVRSLREKGLLVAPITRDLIARKLGIEDRTRISGYIRKLVDLGLVDKVYTGRTNAYVLGTWEDRSRKKDRSHIVEFYFIDQVFGVENQTALDPLTEPGSGGVAENATPRGAKNATPSEEVAESATPEVARNAMPGVAENATHNKEREYRKSNKQQQALSLLNSVPLSDAQRKRFAEECSLERIEEVLQHFRLLTDVRNPAAWLCDAFQKRWVFGDGEAVAKEKIRTIRRNEAVKAQQEREEEGKTEIIRKTVDAWISKYPKKFEEPRRRVQTGTRRLRAPVRESLAIGLDCRSSSTRCGRARTENGRPYPALAFKRSLRNVNVSRSRTSLFFRL